MDTKEYFNRASEKLENMSDKEFLGLLKNLVSMTVLCEMM